MENELKVSEDDFTKKCIYWAAYARAKGLSIGDYWKVVDYMDWIEKKHMAFRTLHNLPEHITYNAVQLQEFLAFIGAEPSDRPVKIIGKIKNIPEVKKQLRGKGYIVTGFQHGIPKGSVEGQIGDYALHDFLLENESQESKVPVNKYEILVTFLTTSNWIEDGSPADKPGIYKSVSINADNAREAEKLLQENITGERSDIPEIQEIFGLDEYVEGTLEFVRVLSDKSRRAKKELNMNKRYKYRGTSAGYSLDRNSDMTIVLYDKDDDDKAPVRLDVRGGLAKYILDIEWTDAEERYLGADWYYDNCFLLNRIEIPSSEDSMPAKIITQDRPRSNDIVIFGLQSYIETPQPGPMSTDEYTSWLKYKVENQQ